MLALQKTKDAQGLELREVPEPPVPGAGEVLIKVAATGICGSDLAIDSWTDSYAGFMSPHLPVTLGHETAGTIAAIGAGVSAGWMERRVVVNPAVACGKCTACAADDPVGCLDRQPIGMVQNGAFASYFLAPADYCFLLPDQVPLELGALIEPLSVGAHALSVAGFKKGDRVLVFGPGPIGQGAAALARAFGAGEVAVVGLSDATRFATLRDMGFDLLFDLAEEGADGRLAAAAGTGFDIVVEATGVPGVINQALGLLRPEGVLAIAGMSEQPASLDLMKLVKNRLQIRGVSRIPPAIWPPVIEAIAADPAGFAPLISHRLPLSRAMEGFALCRRGEASKVVLVPDERVLS